MRRAEPVGVMVRARVTAKTAAASMLIRVQRIQEFQQVVCPRPSKPQAPLASWKSSSTFERRVITSIRVAGVTGVVEWQR